MPIRLDCPSCGRNLEVSESSAGKRVTCPHCQNPLTVPEDVLEAETFGVSATPSPSDSSPSPGPEGNDRRPCPMCGEMIPVEAAKCRFCGEIFDPELRRMEKKKKEYDSDADLSTGEWVAAVLCSGIGCICGIIWMIQGKPKGPKMFGVSLLFALIWGVIRAVIETAAQR
jgi:predicted RNA-binding Zn-ribbon protein involved in translation (DUF1610 family)